MSNLQIIIRLSKQLSIHADVSIMTCFDWCNGSTRWALKCILSIKCPEHVHTQVFPCCSTLFFFFFALSPALPAQGHTWLFQQELTARCLLFASRCIYLKHWCHNDFCNLWLLTHPAVIVLIGRSTGVESNWFVLFAHNPASCPLTSYTHVL